MNTLSKIGTGAVMLIALAVVGKLAWGIGLLLAYGLYVGRRPIIYLLKTRGLS